MWFFSDGYAHPRHLPVLTHAFPTRRPADLAVPIGLAAKAPVMQRQGLSYVRPWLEVDRALILQQAELFASLTGWVPVSAPSNADDQYARAAPRDRLAPELTYRLPSCPRHNARQARQRDEHDVPPHKPTKTAIDRVRHTSTHTKYYTVHSHHLTPS